jgi:hypothetical protein
MAMTGLTLFFCFLRPLFSFSDCARQASCLSVLPRLLPIASPGPPYTALVSFCDKQAVWWELPLPLYAGGVSFLLNDDRDNPQCQPQTTIWSPSFFGIFFLLLPLRACMQSVTDD